MASREEPLPAGATSTSGSRPQAQAPAPLAGVKVGKRVRDSETDRAEAAKKGKAVEGPEPVPIFHEAQPVPARAPPPKPARASRPSSSRPPRPSKFRLASEDNTLEDQLFCEELGEKLVFKKDTAEYSDFTEGELLSKATQTILQVNPDLLCLESFSIRPLTLIIFLCRLIFSFSRFGPKGPSTKGSSWRKIRSS